MSCAVSKYLNYNWLRKHDNVSFKMYISDGKIRVVRRGLHLLNQRKAQYSILVSEKEMNKQEKGCRM